jgi:hypothetical protein
MDKMKNFNYMIAIILFSGSHDGSGFKPNGAK